MLARTGTDILRDELRRRLRAGHAGPHEVWIRWPRQLGDVVFAVPFFGSLQAAWNREAAALGAELRWVAVGHAIGAALFSEAAPEFIAESLIEKGGEGKPDPWHLVRRWQKHPPLCTVNLSQSVRLAFGAWMAGVPIRAGIADNHLSLLYTHPFKYRDLDVHLSHRYEPLLALLTGDPRIAWSPMDAARFGGAGGPVKLRAAGWDGRPFVALAFGTRGDSKRWRPEAEKWPELARMLLDQGLLPVWMGGPEERALGAELASRAPGSLDLTGRTTLPEACAIQGLAYGTVAVDTGLAHTSAGAGRPTVTINVHSPEPLISPVGPHVLMVRGPWLDGPGDPEPTVELRGNSGARLSPRRVLNLLHALAADAGGRTIGAPR